MVHVFNDNPYCSNKLSHFHIIWDVIIISPDIMNTIICNNSSMIPGDSNIGSVSSSNIN